MRYVNLTRKLLYEGQGLRPEGGRRVTQRREGFLGFAAGGRADEAGLALATLERREEPSLPVQYVQKNG